jgi:hypothetical protein
MPKPTRKRRPEILKPGLKQLTPADQARDYWQRYEKAKFSVLRIADNIECERPCSAWVDNLRNTFNETKP